MSARIPAPVRAVLREDLEQSSMRPLPVLSLLTVLPTGWPHIAYLGPGELLDIDDHTLGLAVWDGSNSTQAAVRTGQATLQTVLDMTPHLLRLRIEDRGEIVVAGRTLRALRATVVHAASDAVRYATLTTVNTFEVHDRSEAVRRWRATREQLEHALGAHPDATP